MNYLLAFTPRPAATGPSERLLHLRATSPLCIENEAIWWQRHAWQVNGNCSRCGVNIKNAA